MNIKYIMRMEKIELPAIGKYKANHGFYAIIIRAEDGAEVKGSILARLSDAMADGQRIMERADAYFEAQDIFAIA